MGARTFELDIVPDEATIISSGWVSVDSEAFPIAKRISYAAIRRPIFSGQSLKSSAYALAPSDNGSLIIATSALTVTVPIAGVLGIGFYCVFYGDGASMAVTRAGGGSVTVANGELWELRTANNKILAYKLPAVTVL